MNLSKIIHEVWKDERTRELKIRKSEVELVIKVLIEVMVKNLMIYRKLKMQGLFTLDIRKVKGRKIGHPQTGEHMMIDDYYKVGLEPSKKIKEELKKLK